MSESINQYGILVAVDGSAESDAALRWAAQEAVAREVPVTLMNVIEPVTVTWPVGYLDASFVTWQKDNAEHLLEQAQKTVQAESGENPPPQIHTEIRYSPAVPALADASKKAQMVVVGSRGMGTVGRALLGSVSHGLLHHAHCPVVVLRGDAPLANPGAPVLLGIDGSPASEAATAFAFEEASLRGAPLVALHAWSDLTAVPVAGIDWSAFEEDGREVLAERLAGWQERYPDVVVTRKVHYDRPSHWLIEESEHAQLVVVGSHGRGGFTGMLLGSVSSAVVQGAHVPVVVVRGR